VSPAFPSPSCPPLVVQAHLVSPFFLLCSAATPRGRRTPGAPASPAAPPSIVWTQ
jgi:hypothetical protein